MAEDRSVRVRLRGREFRVRGDQDQESLQRVANHLEETMAKLEERTGTVDSLDIALLTALNLAREVVELREGRSRRAVDPGQLRTLIERVEGALPD